MSFQLMQDCNDMSCDMSSTEHAVLMVLCRYADDDGNNCFPSTAEIARCSHFAVLPVRKAIAGLEASGWIKSQQESGKKRFFTVDVAKIRGALPLPNQVRGINQHPRIDRYVGIDQTVGIDQHPDPVLINTPTPYQSISRRDQLKDQEKKEVVVPVPACEESALHPTIDDYGINPNEDKATSTVTSETENPQPPRTLQGPSYIDPVPFDEIVAAYNRHMAHIGGKVKALEPAQTGAVVAFWECLVIELWETKDDELRTRAGALEQVDHYFRHCAEDGFINGTAKRKPEYKGWIAKFDWLIRESTLRRMLGGGYAPSGAGMKEGR